MRCQLCGFEFDETRLQCHTSCPFNDHCAVVCCPRCGYQTIDEAKSGVVDLLRRALGRVRQQRRSQPQNDLPHPVCCALSRLQTGQGGRLVSIESSNAERIERLQVFGLMPGAMVTLRQRYPEFVLQVGHTELTVEREVASEILVEVHN